MPDRRPQRASRYLIALTLAATLAGALYLWKGVDSRTIYAAAIDLPALHQITQADVRAVETRAPDLPEGAMTGRADLVGRYTLAPVAQDQPFARDRLGPELSPGAITGRRVTGLGVAAADVQGLVARGDEVDVLVPAGSSTVPGTAIRQAIVLDVRDSAPPDRRTLLCAIRTTDEKALLRIGTESRILVVRTSPYASR